MFLAATTNNLDAKGRVSVPADFRAEVSDSGFDGIVVWPAPDGGPFLEGGGIDYVEGVLRSLETMDYYDPTRKAIQHTMMAQSRKLSFDGNGRITLPRDLIDRFGFNGQITFVGLGRSFEIRDPDQYQAEAMGYHDHAKDNMDKLKTMSPKPAVAGGGV